VSIIIFTKQKIINKESTQFQIPDKAENIDFIVFDAELMSKSLYFCGVRVPFPIPLYVNSKKDGLWVIGGGISNLM
jgi:hypothetical protein